MDTILLNPGPTNTLEAVKVSQHDHTDVCHRTDHFREVYDDTKTTLLKHFCHQYHLEWEIGILAGSGTSALEAMIVSLLPEDCTLIVAGKYGQRAKQILETHRIKHTAETAQSIGELSPDLKVRHLYFVENETTTGEKFSLEEICTKFPNADLYIDATSAFGATDYSPYLQRIKSLSFCSNKCLQAPAGLGVVIYQKNAPLYSRNCYTLNLKNYKEQLPFTIPPQLIYALNTSLKQGVFSPDLFTRRRDRLLKDMGDIGIQCINEVPSNTIIGFKHPTKTYVKLQHFLADRGIVIYSGISGIESSFRVSTMSVLFDEYYDKIMRDFYDSCIC